MPDLSLLCTLCMLPPARACPLPLHRSRSCELCASPRSSDVSLRCLVPRLRRPAARFRHKNARCASNGGLLRSLALWPAQLIAHVTWRRAVFAAQAADKTGGSRRSGAAACTHVHARQRRCSDRPLSDPKHCTRPQPPGAARTPRQPRNPPRVRPRPHTGCGSLQLVPRAAVQVRARHFGEAGALPGEAPGRGQRHGGRLL